MKVQVSLASNMPGGRRVFIYSEDRDTVFQEGPIDPMLLGLLKGRPKAFFYVDPPTEPLGAFTLLEEAPWQDW